MFKTEKSFNQTLKIRKIILAHKIKKNFIEKKKKSKKIG